MSTEWRYQLSRLNGDGTENILHPNLPLQEVELTVRENGVNTFSAKLSNKSLLTWSFDYQPYIAAWSSVVYCEPYPESGGEVYAFIIDNVVVQGEDLSITGVGFMGYLMDLPMTHTYEPAGGVVDAGQVMSHIWDTVQSQVGGNIGLTLPRINTGVTVGRPPMPINNKESGPNDKPESDKGEPFKITWPDCTDLLQETTKLTGAGLFYHEKHTRVGTKGGVKHELILSNLSSGVYQKGMRFVEGENVIQTPSTEWGSDYASEVLVYGAGEGTGTVYGYARQVPPKRLRRVRVLTDKSLTSGSLASRIAQRHLSHFQDPVSLTQLSVRDHSNANIYQIRPGDIINVYLRFGYLADQYVDLRVVQVTYKPGDVNACTLTLTTPEVPNSGAE